MLNPSLCQLALNSTMPPCTYYFPPAQISSYYTHHLTLLEFEPSQKHYFCKIFRANINRFLGFETKNYVKEVTFIDLTNIYKYQKGDTLTHGLFIKLNGALG